MNRAELIQQIYSRLATLETEREEARLIDKQYVYLDLEIDALRAYLAEVMHRFDASPEGFTDED